jgi:hypothetical protein
VALLLLWWSLMASQSSSIYFPVPLGFHAGEMPRYHVLRHEGHKEIRRYSSFLTAYTHAIGNFKTAHKIAFRRLADYVFGKNLEHRSISMKTPILMEKMSVNSPLLPDHNVEGWKLYFLLPDKFSLSSAPEPVEDDINFVEWPAQTVAALQFRGLSNERIMNERSDELVQWLASIDVQPAMSICRLAQYDRPMTIPFLRKNEIHIPLQGT